VIGNVDLPIAGIISNERAEIVSQKAASVLEGFKACGCELNNPNMQLSLLALVVIPELGFQIWAWLMSISLNLFLFWNKQPSLGDGYEAV
jgi:hypothetical protein